MSFRQVFLLGILMVGAYFQNLGCREVGNEEWIRTNGPNDRASLVAFFKKDTTNDQINDFVNNVIGAPAPNGTGHYILDGIAGTLHVRNGDYEGYAIQFAATATSEQKEEVKRRVRNSPIVARVYEDAVPNEIEPL